MDPKELDKVFNDVSGLHLPLNLLDAHVRTYQGGSDLDAGGSMVISLYQSDVGWGLKIWARGRLFMSFCVLGQCESRSPQTIINHCSVVITGT